MTENEKRKECDVLVTCFVIHVSLLSLHIFLETAVLQKKLVVYHPLKKFELGISWFSINHRNIDNHISYEKVSCLKCLPCRPQFDRADLGNDGRIHRQTKCKF